MIPIYLAAVLGRIAWCIQAAEMPAVSPPWRGWVTNEAQADRDGWRPSGRWVSTGGPNRVRPSGAGAGRHRRYTANQRGWAVTQGRPPDPPRTQRMTCRKRAQGR
jgi:hypothetical protein